MAHVSHHSKKFTVDSRAGTKSGTDADASLTMREKSQARSRSKSKKAQDYAGWSVLNGPDNSNIKVSNFIVGDRFRLIRKLGSGSFGDIYQAINITSKEEVAVKLESVHNRHPQLLYESKLYKLLDGSVGFPKLKWFGTTKEYNIMVIELLGPSLEDLFNYCGRRFTLKTVTLLADQMLVRTENLHSKNFIHRDMKPDNFLMGLGRFCNKVYMIDFGLSKKFRDSRTRYHIPYRDDKSLTGTARYASINAHRGIEQSRRDDMESLGYVFLYFLRGSLPWQGLKASTKKQKYEKIAEVKMKTRLEDLCRGHPEEFMQYLKYCRHLHFEEVPDYTYLRQLFRKLYRESTGANNPYENGNLSFDWNEKEKRDKSKAELKTHSRDEKTAAAITTRYGPFQGNEDRSRHGSRLK